MYGEKDSLGCLRWRSSSTSSATRPRSERQDVRKIEHRELFERRLVEEQPDEAHLPPTCGPRPSVREPNVHRHPGWKGHLVDLLDWHHRVHLPSSVDVYKMQHGA